MYTPIATESLRGRGADGVDVPGCVGAIVARGVGTLFGAAVGIAASASGGVGGKPASGVRGTGIGAGASARAEPTDIIESPVASIPSITPHRRSRDIPLRRSPPIAARRDTNGRAA